MIDSTTATIASNRQSLQEVVSRCQFSYRTVAKVDRKHFWYVTRNEWITNYIKQRLHSHEKASFLDVGCGCANVTGYLYEHGIRNITGWDMNPAGISICKTRYPYIRFEQKDFLTSQLNFEYEKYDALGVFDCIEHISDDVRALKHLAGLIKPGGRIFITVPAMDSLWSKMDDYYGHFRRYSKQSLMQSMRQAGLRLVECNYIMAPLVPLLMVRRKWRKIRDCETSEQVDEVLARDARLPNFVANEMLKLILRCEQVVMADKDLGIGSSLIATGIVT